METQPHKHILAQVRALMPTRPLTPVESRHIIEQQAMRLLTLTDIAGPPVPTRLIVEQLPCVSLTHVDDLPDSGRVHWDGAQWLIRIARDEALVRQRFSVGHELGHIVFHPVADIVFPAWGEQSADKRLETACDRFAASLLMPRTWMKRAFAESDLQDLPGLARLFGVSWSACRILLTDIGLIDSEMHEGAAA